MVVSSEFDCSWVPAEDRRGRGQLGRRHLHHIQLAGLVGRQGGAFLADHVELQPVHAGRAAVIGRVGREDHLLLGNPLRQEERAVRHDGLRLDPLLLAGPLDHVPRQGHEAGQRGHVDEVGRGVLERHFERAVVQGADADRGGIGCLAGVVGASALEVHQLPVLPAAVEVRRQVALDGPFEIVGGDRLAVAPAHVRPQAEAPDRAVGAGLPGGGQVRRWLQVLVEQRPVR